MNLENFFEKNEGSGALATSDESGAVNVAVYSRPHVFGKDRIAFVMRDRRSRSNLKSNPQAAYMFTIKGQAAEGIRLYLHMTEEETDQEKVLSIRRRKKPLEEGERLFLVYFKVNKARALVGDEEHTLT